MIVLKMLKAFVGVYLALTAAFLSFIGFGAICKRVKEHPGEGAFEAAGNVLQDATNNIRY